VCILGIHAIPSGRIANGEPAKDAPHVCMVLVIRPEMIDTELAALGSGSIISTRHVLTAGHVVHGQENAFRINFFHGTSRRSFESNFALIHSDYDEENYDNDIALLFIQGDQHFPESCIIAISTTYAQTGVEGTVAGYGFTSAQTIGASLNPLSAKQRVSYTCEFKEFDAAESHFCAVDEIYQGIVCPGDNGAGLYILSNTTGENELIGIASRILKGCSTTSALTGYTRISLFYTWIEAIIG